MCILNGFQPVILKHAGTPGHDAGTADAGAGDDYVLITGRWDTGTRDAWAGDD